MKEDMTLKLKAWQGLLAVIIILGIIGGALQLAATELRQNPDATTWMGSYQAPFLAFLQNSWLIIVVTFIYNIFMYFRQNQLAALKQTTEMFQLQKFTATLAWFIGILGPAAALIADKQLQGIIAFIIVIVTAVIKELQSIYSNQTILQPITSGSPNAPTQSTPQPPAQGTEATTTITTYGPWFKGEDLFTRQTIWGRNVYHNGAFFSQEYSSTDPAVKVTPLATPPSG